MTELKSLPPTSSFIAGHSAVRAVAAYLLLLNPFTSEATGVQTRNLGKTLNGNLELAEGETLNDGAVLIFHALMQHYDTEIIRGLQAGLKDAGHNSLAINLSLGVNERRGNLECSGPHTAVFDDAIDEGVVWLKWLKQQGAKRVVLMVHSSGANQALGLAVDHHDPEVAGVILLAPMTTGPARAISAYSKRWRTSFDEVLSKAKAQIDQGKGDQLMLADFAICPQTQVTPEAFVDYYVGRPLRFDPSRYLRRVAVPVQIILVATMCANRTLPLSKQRRRYRTVDEIQLFCREGALKRLSLPTPEGFLTY